jgi:hypothetical protein
MAYGVFSRRESPTQSPADALEQVRSGEIWGSTARYNCSPCVRAYASPLVAGQRGIDFATRTAPHPHSMPFEVRWYHPETIGVVLRSRGGSDFACIDAAVTNNQP